MLKVVNAARVRTCDGSTLPITCSPPAGSSTEVGSQNRNPSNCSFQPQERNGSELYRLRKNASLADSQNTTNIRFPNSLDVSRLF
jgi:hypothetical protein